MIIQDRVLELTDAFRQDRNTDDGHEDLDASHDDARHVEAAHPVDGATDARTTKLGKVHHCPGQRLEKILLVTSTSREGNDFRKKRESFEKYKTITHAPTIPAYAAR